MAARELVIPWRDDAKTLFMLFFALAFGGCSLCLLIYPSSCGLPFLVAYGGAALLCAWDAVATCINKTRIAMTSTSLQVSHAPVRGFTQASICASEIAAVTWRSARDDGVVVSRTVVVCCPDGTRRDVWVPLKNEYQARFAAQAIALYFGVPYLEEVR